MVAEIVEQLKEEARRKKYSILHILVDDASDWREGFHPYEKLSKEWSGKDYEVVHKRLRTRHRKELFWKTWTILLQRAMSYEFGHAIAIPDDCLLCEDFLTRSRNGLEKKRKSDESVVAMNLRASSITNWGLSRWVDGAFTATRDFFEVLNWKMVRVPRTRQKTRGSGVGKQMSERLRDNKEYQIAVVRDVSFIKPRYQNTQSKMFPPQDYPQRKLKWGRQNFIDDAEKT
jgi:hypothetical protein